MGQEKDKLYQIVEDQIQEIIHDSDDFPLPRIEQVAATAKKDLSILKESLSKEELSVAPDTNDVLMGIRANDYFVKNDLFPILNELMNRTSRMVPMGEESYVGYANIPVYSEDDEGEEEIVSWVQSLIVDDEEEEGGIFIMSDPKEMQEAWDKSSEWVRLDLKAFSKMNRGQIMDCFLEYINLYV